MERDYRTVNFHTKLLCDSATPRSILPETQKNSTQRRKGAETQRRYLWQRTGPFRK
jgi:hypothetical protein